MKMNKLLLTIKHRVQNITDPTVHSEATSMSGMRKAETATIKSDVSLET
jgi:hypothetical protein